MVYMKHRYPITILLPVTQNSYPVTFNNYRVTIELWIFYKNNYRVTKNRNFKKSQLQKIAQNALYLMK